jgi:hypothetical protein
MQANSSNEFYKVIFSALPLEERAPVVVISPHIDDAVWSLGPVLKTLANHGHLLRLINLFSTTLIMGDEVGTPAHDTEIRKAEESDVALEVGFGGVVYLDFPDGILRDREPETIFDPTYKTPEWLAKTLLTALKKRIPEDAVVLAPSGFGWHVDHQLAARVASELPQKVIFYEDLPYAARTVRVDEARKFLEGQGAREIRISANSETVQEHLRLYRLYESQRAKHHEEQISAYLANRGYGFWTVLP